MYISAGSFLHTRPALDGRAVPSPWNLFKGQRQNAVPDLVVRFRLKVCEKAQPGLGAWVPGASKSTCKVELYQKKPCLEPDLTSQNAKLRHLCLMRLQVFQVPAMNRDTATMFPMLPHLNAPSTYKGYCKAQSSNAAPFPSSLCSSKP